MPTSYPQLLLAAYAAIGIFVAVVYMIVDQVRTGQGRRRPIVSRSAPGRQTPSGLFARLTFFIKVIIMWPWILYTLLRSK